MWEYVQNTQTGIVHISDGCADARQYGRSRGWRRLGAFLDLSIAAIETTGPGGRVPPICATCEGLERP